MADLRSYNLSTPKGDLPLRVDVNPSNVYETLPSGLGNRTDNVAVTPGVATTPSVPTLVDIYDSEAIDPEYQAKSHAISCAMQEIGMGRYQVRSPYRV